MGTLRVVRSVVTQEDIETVIGLRNQIRHLRKLLRRQLADILLKMLAGARVEQGTHSVELDQKTEGGIQTTRLVIF